MAVLATGRNEKRLDELAAAIGDPDRVATVAVDLTDDDGPARVVQAAVEKWGRIDFLINNAGVGNPTPLHDTDDETLDYFLNVMLRAPFRLARDVLPHMEAGSAIINITSTFAVVGGLRGGSVLRGQRRFDRADHPHRLSVRVARHPLQRRRSRGDPDTDDRRTTAGPAVSPNADRDDPAPATRHRRGRREHGGVLVFARRQFHQRADHRGRRWMELDEIPVQVRLDVGVDSAVNAAVTR